MTIQNNFPAIKPSLNLDFANTKQLDPRITFARASTARYYDGKTTAKAEENLLIYSQELDNSGLWGTVNTSITANSTTAPDGTTTAETITETTSTSIHSLFQSPVGNFLAANTSYTFSAFVKDIDRRYVTLAVSGSNGTFFSATYDLTGVTVTANNASGTGYSHTSSSITSVGSGWYRLVVTGVVGTVVSVQSINISLSTNGTPSLDGRGRESYLGTSKAVYAWGVQIEQRSTVTAYTPTTTAPITNYIPVLQTASAGTPRFDHNPITGESLGLLIEEQRTNLVLRSEEFDNAAWIKDSATISANSTTAPNGTVTADKIVSAAATAATGVGQTTTFAVATYTGSVYAKIGEARFVQLLWSSSASTNYANFDLQTGTVTAGTYTSATITSVGDGWYRLTITSTLAAGSGGLFAWLQNSGTAVRGASYIGDGTSGIFLWGAQLEAGAFATSYIPTVASQVTRAADSASITGSNFSSWYNVNEGTIYASASTASVATNSSIYAFTDSLLSSINSIYGNSGAQNHLVVRINNSTVANLNGGTFTSGVNGNSAGAYKLNDFAVSVNGGVSTTDDTGVVPVVDRLFLGASVNGVTFGSQTIKRIAYYPRRLTNTQIQALTS